MSTLATSFLIGSYSFLNVTSTALEAWMGSKFGKSDPELVALERLKNLHRLIMGEMLSLL